MGYSPWGRKELDMTERPHFLFITTMDTKLHSLAGNRQAGLFFTVQDRL